MAPNVAGNFKFMHTTFFPTVPTAVGCCWTCENVGEAMEVKLYPGWVSAVMMGGTRMRTTDGGATVCECECRACVCACVCVHACDDEK